VATVPDVTASFLLIIYARSTAAGFSCGAPWQGGAKGFATPLSTAFILWGACSNKVLRASTPFALISSYSTFRGGVICSAAFRTGRCRACMTALGGAGEGSSGSHSHSEFLA